MQPGQPATITHHPQGFGYFAIGCVALACFALGYQSALWKQQLTKPRTVAECMMIEMKGRPQAMFRVARKYCEELLVPGMFDDLIPGRSSNIFDQPDPPSN